MNIRNRSTLTVIALTAALTGAGLSGLAVADSHGHMEEGHMEEGHGYGKAHGHDGAMHEMKEDMGQNVMGHGVVNKVIGKAHMINITHEPMEALNWPKMRMNFKVDKSIDLSEVKPGQQVEFMLQVRDGNNYLVKELKAK